TKAPPPAGAPVQPCAAAESNANATLPVTSIARRTLEAAVSGARFAIENVQVTVSLGRAGFGSAVAVTDTSTRPARSTVSLNRSDVVVALPSLTVKRRVCSRTLVLTCGVPLSRPAPLSVNPGGSWGGPERA